jgi:hypothetical protein
MDHLARARQFCLDGLGMALRHGNWQSPPFQWGWQWKSRKNRCEEGLVANISHGLLHCSEPVFALVETGAKLH